MILNVDLNPGIRRDIYVDKLRLGAGNSIESSIISLEGSGGNIAYLLNLFDVESRITGFLGSYNQEIYYRLLGEGSTSDFIKVKDKIYEKLNIIDQESSRSSYFQEELKIRKDEVTDFINNYHSILDSSSYVLLTDNLNKSLSEGLYKKLVMIAKIKKKPLMLEAKNPKMMDVIEEGPEILIPSLEILSKRSNLILDNKETIAASANYFLKGDTETVLVNLYEKGLLLITREASYYLDPVYKDYLKKDNYGLMAGMAVALDRNYDFETRVKLAQACNIAYNNTRYVSEIDLFQIKKEMGKLKIYEL